MNSTTTAKTLRPTVAFDMDRTLIYSRSAILDFAPDFELTTAEVVEYYENRPLSYMATATIEVLKVLDTQANIVPVTTRTIEQYQRINLPFTPEYAVTSSGGTILHHGIADAHWHEQVLNSVAAGGCQPEEALTWLRQFSTHPGVKGVRIADGLFCYVVCETATHAAEIVSFWDAWSPPDWNATRQGRKAYFMPNLVSKATGLQAVITRIYNSATAPMLFAAGDGQLDAPMLELANVAIRPRHGELEELNWHCPQLTVTQSSGLAASTEMVSWILNYCSNLSARSELNR